MLRDSQPGSVRFFIGGDISFAVVVFGSQKHQNSRDNTCTPQRPDAIPRNRAAADKRCQYFTEYHDGYTEWKEHGEVRQCAGENRFFQVCVTFIG